MRSIFTRAAGIAALAMTVSATASAQNLVTNGGFETGDLTGWTIPSGAPCGGPSVSTYPNSGSYSASFGQVNCWGMLQQDLATSAGQNYDISFWGRSIRGGTPNGFQVYFGDLSTPVFQVSNVGAVYTQYTFSGTATGASTTLRIEGFNNPEYNQLDDVSVTAANVTATPEPSSMALLGTGLVGLVPMIRRRRK